MTQSLEPQHSADADLTVSIIIPTYDRPDDLRECLDSLTQQHSRQPVEIVIADNHPESGQTAAVVAAYPDVKLVDEPRMGISYARNAAILASSGAILIATDDDVIAPPDYVDTVLAQFANPAVDVVTGNVLPHKLETDAEKLFEKYTPLGRGYDPATFDADWFRSFHLRSVPAHYTGVGANWACRRAVLADPRVGLFNEVLGSGSPTGTADDTYMFYRILRAGYTIHYEPSVWVWHKHRSTWDTLRHQLHNHSKGMIAFEIETFLNDGDWRGLWQVLVRLPVWRAREVIGELARMLRGHKSDYWWLLWTFITAESAGFGAWWHSRRRVAKLGRSGHLQPQPGPERSAEIV
ncbi:MAG: glycosyltransferase [Anaerolineae bacterium]|nr:glycosyltransferase [Anaerolineae bacterium]